MNAARPGALFLGGDEKREGRPSGMTGRVFGLTLRGCCQFEVKVLSIYQTVN